MSYCHLVGQWLTFIFSGCDPQINHIWTPILTANWSYSKTLLKFSVPRMNIENSRSTSTQHIANWGIVSLLISREQIFMLFQTWQRRRDRRRQRRDEGHWQPEEWFIWFVKIFISQRMLVWLSVSKRYCILSLSNSEKVFQSCCCVSGDAVSYSAGCQHRSGRALWVVHDTTTLQRNVV